MRAVAAVGDNVADVYPSLGCLFPGGNALNVAVAARRAGVSAAYLGAIGTDGPGRAIKAALDDEGVSTDRLRIIEGPNAYSVVELDGGDRRFVAYDLGVSRFTLEDADLDYLAEFDCVHSGARSGTEDQLREMASFARCPSTSPTGRAGTANPSSTRSGWPPSPDHVSIRSAWTI